MTQALIPPADGPLDHPPVEWPPADLWSDEPPMESDLHRRQMEILIQSAEAHFAGRNDFYATGNLTIYYSLNQSKSTDFRGPDFFLVLGVERRERRSWAVWQEGGRYPNVIIEILSDSTTNIDRGLKKQIYQDVFRTPEYFWFDPESLELAGFHLTNGAYAAFEPDTRGWLWSRQMEVYLGVHEGKLRFFTAEGELIPLPAERTEQERERAELERQRAEQERERAELERQRAEQLAEENARLREQLRTLGIDLP